MTNKGLFKYVVLTSLGFVLVIGGIFMALLIEPEDGLMKTLPFVCVGVGAGIFGGGLGTLLKRHVSIKDEQAAKRIEIEEKDERNIVLRSHAKAKAYDVMLYVHSALLMFFALMQVETYVVLSLVAVYLFVIIVYIWSFARLNKKM